MVYNELVLRKKLAVAIAALRTIKADWTPGRRKAAVDPFTVANVALERIEADTYEGGYEVIGEELDDGSS